MKRSCLPDDWLLLILLILHFQQMSALIEGQNDLFLVIFCSLLSKIWWQILKKSLIFSTYLCHEAIVWRRKDCNSRPVKSDAFGVSLMHSRSNSRSHTGMWKSNEKFLIPYILLFSLIFNITPCWSGKYCVLFAAFIIFCMPLHRFSWTRPCSDRYILISYHDGGLFYFFFCVAKKPF